VGRPEGSLPVGTDLRQQRLSVVPCHTSAYAWTPDDGGPTIHDAASETMDPTDPDPFAIRGEWPCASGVFSG
jgi:hypothetical protein